MHSRNVLILPGWHNSGPHHWQSLWEAMHGYTRVAQHSWTHPLRGDWIARLEDVLLSSDEPAVLVAHSLGCVHVAAWASHSNNTHRVKAALLAAPPDIEREDMRTLLPSWSPMPLQKLPFVSVLFASTDDPYCEPQRARHFADAWGSQFHDAGAARHLNAESELDHWPEAHIQLQQLMAIHTA